MGEDLDLRGSLAEFGCIDPVLIWLGIVIDGRKRHALCAELGIVPKMHVCVSLEAACAALFLKHPERAIQLAREHLGGHAGLAPSIQEIARVCHVRVSAIAVHVHKQRPPDKRAPHRTAGQRSEPIYFFAEPQWKHYVKITGEMLGMNLSQTIRVACWEFVQRNHPRTPTEGTRRGPLPENIRKPSRIKKPP